MSDMLYVLDFRGGPLNGQTSIIPRRPSSITITFDEGPCAIYIQGRVTERVGEATFLEMVETDYDQIIQEEKT